MNSDWLNDGIGMFWIVGKMKVMMEIGVHIGADGRLKWN